MHEAFSMLAAAVLLCASLRLIASQPPEEDDAAGADREEYCEGPSEVCGSLHDVPQADILCNMQSPNCYPKTQDERAIIEMITSVADWRARFKTREEIHELQLEIFGRHKAEGKLDGDLCCETENSFQAMCGKQIAFDKEPWHVLCFPTGSTTYYQFADVGTCWRGGNHCSSKIGGKCRSMPKYVSLYSVDQHSPSNFALRMFNVSGYCSCQPGQ